MADNSGIAAASRGAFFRRLGRICQPRSDRRVGRQRRLNWLMNLHCASCPDMSEEAAREAVDACVHRFNDLDGDGWINTIEREDIYEQIGRVIDLCGFGYDEEWVGERDW